jgi:hypothetical protein
MKKSKIEGVSMNKTVRIVIYFLIFDAVVIAGYFGLRSLRARGPSGSEKYEWVTIDANYTPKDYIEEYIKTDSEAKGTFPVYLRNYGKDPSVLKKFKGSNFAGPSEAVLNMSYKGMEDWKLVEVKYTNEKKKEVRRTILYVMFGGTWRVGDSGKLMK